MDGTIYFLQGKDSGNIKIGFSTNPVERKALLQTATWEDLKNIGEIWGTLKDEHIIRKRFSNLRIRGEWFRPGAELLAFIELETSKRKNTIHSLGDGEFRFEFSWPVKLTLENQLIIGTHKLRMLVDEQRSLITGIEGDRETILSWWKTRGATPERLAKWSSFMH